MAKGLRRSERRSGSGTRESGQIVSLERRCTALERDVSLLTVDERLRQLARRVTVLEAKKTG